MNPDPVAAESAIQAAIAELSIATGGNTVSIAAAVSAAVTANPGAAVEIATASIMAAPVSAAAITTAAVSSAPIASAAAIASAAVYGRRSGGGNADWNRSLGECWRDGRRACRERRDGGDRGRPVRGDAHRGCSQPGGVGGLALAL